MMYQNKKNNRFATVIEENPKFNTVLLQFEDDKSTTSITTSTLKRWWKKIEAPEVVEPVMDLDNPITENEAKELGRIDGEKALELEEDEVAGDGTPYKEVMQQIIHDGKVTTAKVSNKGKSRKVTGINLGAQISNVESMCKVLGLYVKMYESEPRTMNIYNKESKMTCVIYLGNSKLVVLMRENSVPKGVAVSRIRKCPLSHAVDISYADMEVSLKNLLSKIKYVPTQKKKEDK